MKILGPCVLVAALVFVLSACDSGAGGGGGGESFVAPSGSVDPGFTTGTGANSTVKQMVLQPDGKVLVCGSFSQIGLETRRYLARLNSDGTLDTAFFTGTGADDEVMCMAVLPNGKILVAGDFTQIHGTAVSRIARLNADGTLDATFNPGTGPNQYVTALTVTDTGKIYISGTFTTYNGTSCYRLARLNTDGSLDAAFDTTGSELNDPAVKIIIQPDDRILVAGLFNSIGGTVVPYIARFNTDGTRDTTFSPPSDLNGRVTDMALLSDGKILIAGWFTVCSTLERYRIARLNANGSLDTAFDTSTGANNAIAALALQPDGRILVAGTFTQYKGTAVPQLIRLNADATLDTGFDPGTASDGNLFDLLLQPNGRLLVCGSFTAFGGETRKNIVRLQ